MESYLELIAPLAKYVEEKEPEALGYAGLRSDKVSEQLMLLERFTTRDFRENAHKQSAEYKRFKELEASGAQNALEKLETICYLE